jgi:hypothetical protein
LPGIRGEKGRTAKNSRLEFSGDNGDVLYLHCGGIYSNMDTH